VEQNSSWCCMRRSIASIIGVLGLAVLVLHSVLSLGEASDDDVKLLLSALASDSCDRRLEGISRYSRSEDNERYRNAALKRLSNGTPSPLREQVLSLVEVLEDGRKGSARILTLTQKVGQLDSVNKGDQDRLFGQIRQELLRIIHSPAEPVAARIGASWPLVRILLAAAGDHPDWETEWAQSLEPMLRSRDGSLRVVGAAIAALRRFPEGSDPIKATLVRPLIDGLRHDSVSVRSAAYLGLRQVAQGIGSATCFSATDPPDRRAAAIRQWEEWWNESKEQLALERLAQKFW